jgi:hypothetical protein
VSPDERTNLQKARTARISQLFGLYLDTVPTAAEWPTAEGVAEREARAAEIGVEIGELAEMNRDLAEEASDEPVT